MFHYRIISFTLLKLGPSCRKASADTHKPLYHLKISTQIFFFRLSSQALALSASPSKRRDKHKAWNPLAQAQSAPNPCQGACWSPCYAEKWQQSLTRVLHWPFHLQSLPWPLLLVGRLDLFTIGMTVDWHDVGSLPVGMQNTQQRCPCVNTVYLLIPFLFIIFALNEITSLHPPGDSLVPIKDILG